MKDEEFTVAHHDSRTDTAAIEENADLFGRSLYFTFRSFDT